MLSITPQNQLLSRKDSNLNSLDQNQMCCRYTTGQFIVGAIGLEPMNSKEGGFTVRSNCRYATLPNKVNRRWFSGHLFLRLALLWCISPNSDDTDRYTLSCHRYHLSLINLCTNGWARTTDTWFWRPVLYQLSYRRVY